MGQLVFPVNDKQKYEQAGATDLIQLLAAPGCNSLFVEKAWLETLVYGICNYEFIHLSGPTGSGKTSIIEALTVAENFRALCNAVGFKEKPLTLYPIEMVIFDTPGELVQRRALDKGTTYDENSALVGAIMAADKAKKQSYPVVWLREIGRVHTSSIQGGLLNLMTRGEISLPSGVRIEGSGISWIADSNYQAENDATHTLVVFDDAFKRRFTMNLTLNYPSPEQEAEILQHLTAGGELPKVDDELIVKVVKLGQVIRRNRTEGNLLSVVPPTIYGYMAFLRMAHALPTASLQQVAMSTLLGNASFEDRKIVSGVFNEVFGLQTEYEEDPTMAGSLF